MLAFAHAGIAAGAAVLFEIVSAKKKWLYQKPGLLSEKEEKRGTDSPIRNSVSIDGRFRIDYRAVILGSLLPDIIDKPIWLLTEGTLFVSGRSYGHSLLFSLLLFIAGLILLRRRKAGLLTLSLAGFSHLLLDEMWRVPVTLWWPLLGAFRDDSPDGWLPGMFQPLLARPLNYLPEIIEEILGLVVVLYLMYRLMGRKGIKRFITTGNIR